MKKYTKGEWAFDEHISYVSKYRVYSCIDGSNVGWFDPDEENEENGLGNITLISTAPELLETLEGCMKAIIRLVEKYNPDDIDSEWVGEANEVIRKAKGI